MPLYVLEFESRTMQLSFRSLVENKISNCERRLIKHRRIFVNVKEIFILDSRWGRHLFYAKTMFGKGILSSVDRKKYFATFTLR